MGLVDDSLQKGTMEGSTGSEGIGKPWDHAWSTEEMRKNRRDWSLAGDSGLLKHLQQFSDDLTKRANETQEAINSMASQLNETAIIVDNLTNTSLALANTQFIESRVQEDNIEIEQPVEEIAKNENDHEFSATDLLVSVCESIRQGLSIMDEKYEKVEVVASDSEDEDDNAVPSVILRPKDPYQDRPLPYVIGTEQWKSSNKVGLESSSSESEPNDEDEDSVSDTDEKNVGNILTVNPRTNLGISRLSSTSSESNDYNVESSSIKDTDNSRLHARSQDTLNSDTEPTTPSSVLPKSQNINNGPPSFAEELAKRLGNVLPPQKNVITPDSNEQVINRSKDDIFSQENDDQDVFNNKSDDLFSEGKNLFSDEVSSSSWKNKPVRPVNKTIIPPSIDVPPPLSIISSAPKSTIDDLFGDVDDSEDSDDIFSKKSSRDIYASERETIRSEVARKQKNPYIENVQNTSTMTTSTPETNDKGKGLFEDEDDDDLFGSAAKPVQPPQSSLGSAKKKPVGGVLLPGNVDFSTSKFARRPPSTSSSESDSTEQRIASNTSERLATPRTNSNSNSNSGGSGGNVCSSLEAGNNAAGNSTAMSSVNNTAGSGNGSSSGISIRQPSIDNTAGSSLGADFQPLMSSSRLKSEEIYRERVASDSLFAARSRTNADSSSVAEQQRQQHQQQQQQQSSSSGSRQSQQQQQQAEDGSEHEDVFGPPPLPKASDKPKSKQVASLFDDSDSGDDLFASASPGSRSLKSSERTPAKTTSQQPSQSSQQQPKRKSLFDDDDDLFGPRDAPDVDLFGSAPVKSLSKVTDGLFEEVEEPATDAGLLGVDDKHKISEKSKVSGDQGSRGGLVNTLFGEVKVDKVPEKKRTTTSLFPELEDPPDTDLFGKANLPAAPDKNSAKYSSSSKSLLKDASDSELFGSSSSKNVLEKSRDSLFGDSAEPADLFGSSDISRTSDQQKTTKKQEPVKDLFENTKKQESGKDLFENTRKQEPVKDLFEDAARSTRPKKLPTSIFDDSDEDDQDLFGGGSFLKGAKDKKAASIFEDEESASAAKRKMEDEAKQTAEVEKPPAEKKEVEKSEASVEKVVTASSKSMEKSSGSSIFGDEAEDDDDDDLFGDRKKKLNSSVKAKKSDGAKIEDKRQDTVVEAKPKPELAAKPNVAPKKAIFTEIRQKLEKQKLVQPERTESTSSVDGAVSSKKEPPKTLKIQTTLPIPTVADEPTPPERTSGQPPKKPVVSGKIKNLMGKMGDLKILSPTDTPPLWRKSTEEKSSSNDDEHEEQSAAEIGSSEGSTPSLLSGGSSPQNSGTNSRARDSPSLKSDNTEVAISFDEPAQVETLTSIASKNRARIPAKRRPQSRHARQSALRNSGIDFDIVDASTSPTDEQQQQLNGDASDVQLNVDRLLPSRTSHTDGWRHHNTADTVGHTDDRSELSASRNTTTNLLSPSTDEEDLFDVPPDLPEDPAAKEDSLFGRAPILSPIEAVEKPKKKVESAKKERGAAKGEESRKKDEDEEEEEEEEVLKRKEKGEEKSEPLDPLRDESHDPLKDPSQLFAFVTKTPSPEKNKGLLLNEDDDSLFSSSSKPAEKATETKSKPALDLFVDDDDTSGSDLFSSSKTKIKKKPLRDTKIDLFDEATPEDDDDDGLFGPATKKSEKAKSKESSLAPSAAPTKVNEKTDSKNTKPAVKDIFDNSSDDDGDIFAGSKKTIPKKKTKSLFDDDEDNADDDDIFGKPKSSVLKDSKTLVDNGRPMVKKAVTRDLKKTAEKIIEDPLSMLQDD